MKTLFVFIMTLVAALFATPVVQAQSTNWSGTNILSALYGTPTDSDVIDSVGGAVLIVTNGGSLTAQLLNVGPTNAGTLTLLTNAAITVQTLMVTNNTFAATNSVFNFNGGTLITSNGPASVMRRVLRWFPTVPGTSTAAGT